ncbi:MAG: MBOAT family O-acyltransferase [Bacteroidales bacterium]|nr:MBOAT family O-acyltransferase [Bacteroidales bacterium]
MDTIFDNILNLLTYDAQSPIIFSSGLFLALFVGFTFVYYVLSETFSPRILFVTLFSYYFYYKSSGIYFLLLAVVTLSDFLIARAIHRNREENAEDPDEGRSFRRWMLALSLVIDLGFLAYFKYANFFGANLSLIIGHNFQPWDIFLPVGISFFTFQSMSNTIDVYRGDLKPLPSLLDYAFYVSFFPQLVAGPIVRARDFAPQIRKPLVVNDRMIAMGVYLIIIGLFKKAVISDYISLNFVDRVFDNPLRYTGVENLLGLVGYTMQIYCDFSGYSDMAIGIALLLGFRFPVNFNAPFRADSVTDFWRRWHISLSSWIRDYIYISLGGNRKGTARACLNIFITMLLGGLWHGASWNFVLWGAIWGGAQVAHRLFRTKVLHRDRHYVSHGWRRVGAVASTFVFVLFTFMVFRNSHLQGVTDMLSQIFTKFHPEVLGQCLSGYAWVFVLIAFGYVTHWMPDRWQNRLVAYLSRCNMLVYVLLLTAVIYIICQVKTSDVQPFIYFQF